MDTHYLKLSGKAELPKAITAGVNIHVSIEGSVISETKTDNFDGTYTYSYKFSPIKMDVLNELGEMLKLKDTRRNSVLFRATVWKIWNKTASTMDPDDFYDKVMARIIYNADDLLERYASDLM